MALFTVFMDYEGGTYVDQVRARNPTEAVRKWARQFDLSVLGKKDAFAREDLIREIEDPDERPIRLKETVNFWVVIVLPRDDRDVVLINIAKTVTCPSR